jgi:TPR repeat protein
MRNILTAWTCALLLGTSPAMAADAGSDPTGVAALHQQLDRATSPADIVRIADQLLLSERKSPALAAVAETRERAAATLQTLSSNTIRLSRAAFKVGQADPAQRADLRLAALGDSEAALRLAQRYRHGESAFPVDAHRYIAWLQFAAELGNDSAAYALALFYRQDGQPAMAAIYETRAVALGYTPPLALDHIRK